MKGRYVAALGVTAAIAAGATTVAVGQGTGGTLGPKARGSTTLQVRIMLRDVGAHCANTNNVRRCMRQRNSPIGSIFGGSGAVFEGQRRVGRVHFTNVGTQRGRNGGALFLATFVLNDGSITLQGIESEGEAPSAITGGTGAYAGARGYTAEEEAGGSQREFRINITFTFIP